MLPGDRRFPSVRITGDVDGVALVLAELQSREESGVENGGFELGDAPADGLVELPLVVDLMVDDEPLRSRTFTYETVERKRLAGKDDMALHDVGDAVDVGDARLAALMLGRKG